MPKKKKSTKRISNKKFSIAAVFVVTFAAVAGLWLLRNSFASYQQKVTNTYSNFAWPYSEEGYQATSWSVTPISDPSPQGFFWANQFGIRKSVPNSGGYAGLQTSTLNRTNKIAIFSIWNAVGATSPGTATTFGNEGSGYKTTINYDWKTGIEYRFRVEYAGTTTSGNKKWKATIKDVSTSVVVEIGTIEVPGSWAYLNDQVITFTEYFYGTITDCTNIPYTSVKFTKYAMGGLQPTYQNNTYESGQSCAASSKVTNLVDGVLHEIGSPGNAPPPTVTQDTIAPVVSIYQPNQGELIRAGSYTVNAAATDNIKVASMQILINGSVVANSSSGSIQTSWNATGPNGRKQHAKNYDITVTATDTTGNIGRKTYTISVTR